MNLPLTAVEAIFNHLDSLAISYHSNYLEWPEDPAAYISAFLAQNPLGNIPPIECKGFSVGPHSHIVFETSYDATHRGKLTAIAVTALCFEHKEMNNQDMYAYHTLVRPGEGTQTAICDGISFTEIIIALPLPWGIFAYDDASGFINFIVSGGYFPVSRDLNLPDIVVTALDGEKLPSDLENLTIPSFWGMVHRGQLVQVFDGIVMAEGLMNEPESGSFMLTHPTNISVGKKNLCITANRPYINMRRFPLYGRAYSHPYPLGVHDCIDIYRTMSLIRKRGLAFLRGVTEFS